MTANKNWIHPTSRKSEKVDISFSTSYSLAPSRSDAIGLIFSADVDDFGKGGGTTSFFHVRMTLKEAEQLAKSLQNYVDKYKDIDVK
jgi:hypothetical protein